jgi:hypothetical protein
MLTSFVAYQVAFLGLFCFIQKSIVEKTPYQQYLNPPVELLFRISQISYILLTALVFGLFLFRNEATPSFAKFLSVQQKHLTGYLATYQFLTIAMVAVGLAVQLPIWLKVQTIRSPFESNAVWGVLYIFFEPTVFITLLIALATCGFLLGLKTKSPQSLVLLAIPTFLAIVALNIIVKDQLILKVAVEHVADWHQIKWNFMMSHPNFQASRINFTLCLVNLALSITLHVYAVSQGKRTFIQKLKEEK